MGYAIELRSAGNILLSKQYNYSKNYNDGLQGWDADTPMHVASASKLITAMAMTQLLRDHGIAWMTSSSPGCRTIGGGA
jgi:CubicO group peptidase (beta-lactamase class C family)